MTLGLSRTVNHHSFPVDFAAPIYFAFYYRIHLWIHFAVIIIVRNALNRYNESVYNFETIR
jgi:hypothetical protein